MTYQVLYIDDEIDSRDTQFIQSHLEKEGVLECRLELPPKQLADISPRLLDGLLVDLDLSSGQIDNINISYYGSTLASEVRLRFPACPIILITRPDVITSQPRMVRQLLEDSIDVDLILDKDEVIENPGGARNKIVALIEGFQALKEVSDREWDAVIELIGASKEEAELLREAAPPIDQGRWIVPQVARWVRNVVMGYPGILYDNLTTASRLGIDLDSFFDSNVQELLEPAKYTGVFGTYRERWWRNRLLGIAQSLMIEYDLQDAIFQNFAKAFEKKYHQKLQASVCIVDGSEHAEWVCHILKRPVKQRNSIPYYPDNRPAVMDEARVSFKAIQESNLFDENLVDADSLAIVEKLWQQV